MKPEDVQYTHGDKADMFTTHKVVHSKWGSKRFPFQGPQDESRIRDVPELEKTGIDAGILETLIEAINNLSSDQDTMGGNVGSSSLEQQLIASELDDPKTVWKNYFSILGKLSEPQLFGKDLGADLYDCAPSEEEFSKCGIWRENILKSNSQFHVRPVVLNAKVPMLVSKNNKMAVNALYAEPKEVYLSEDMFSMANEKLVVDKIELVAYGNKVKINSGVTTELQMYRPKFKEDEKESWEDAESHICNIFKQRYSGQSQREFLYSSFDRDLSSVPWRFHTAMLMACDDNDTISLENGARKDWLMARGSKINLEWEKEEHRLPDNFENEMNRTWYFRMYGPEEKGQDIKTQTVSRFS